MKVLFVHDRFGSFGGAESNIFAVARALAQKGHEPGILHGPGTGKGESAWGNLFQKAFPLSANKCDAIRTALWSFEPSVIYVHKMADLEVLQMLLGSGVPAVRMVHDHDLYCMRSYKYHWLSRRICTRPASLYCVFRCGACVARNHSGFWPLRWISYRAKRKELALNRGFSRLVVASEYMKQELLRNGFDGARIEIHPPVPVGNGECPASSFSDRNLLVYSGQIIRGKGVDVLLRALAQVTAPFECIILGDGNHRRHCERLAQELGLSSCVRFAGFVPQEQLRQYFSQATAAVMSSVWPEPYGASGLEAMRFGLPVVAFDAGAIKEWLIDGVNGFLVPWMDTRAFAQRVDQLLTDKILARTLGARGRECASAQHEFATYVARLEELFVRVAAPAAEEVAV